MKTGYNMELTPKYDAAIVESKWYSQWESAGLFKETNDPKKAKYTITIPPPNITGSLHMGHSLCYPTQDAIGRYKQLKGYDVLIVPGQDHAGIATQSVVTKQLKAQGISPSDIGRDAFVEKTWEWRKVSGDTILNQFRLLGCGFDWSKSRFTLDPDYAGAVLQIFIDWFNRGLIYRGKRVVNWDPVLKTSVSDIETLRKDTQGKLYHIRYPYADGSGEVIVATTRPETMLGDVAVAVHPTDKRYTDKIGKMVILPLSNRQIPIIADQYPDPEFGTGAVKITPAHDPNDYEVGARHGLEMPVILDESANVCLEGPYFGLNRYEARKRIVQDLEDGGFLVKIEDHAIALIVSDRSGEVVEPLLSEQWFVKQTELAKDAIAVVKEGKITFTPERYTKVYLDWMENIRDWCISRQLWWGHRIPVYYTQSGAAVAALSWDEAQKQAGDDKIVRQDDDVLDTWFSSGLWPFATLGWPKKTELLEERYPTSVLVTDRNIIYLWVARMIMMGMDVCKQIPFDKVCIHATVMAADGRRMSKSLGTGVDPTEVIEKVGADALRFTLLSQAGSNQEIRYSEKKTEDARNFCNKIWNASRFLIMQPGFETAKQPLRLETIDKWLLTRLHLTIELVTEAYEEFDFQRACQAMYQFFWSEYCDWYIEVAKPRINDPEQRDTPIFVMRYCLDAFLKLMHPIMPHITEEIYQFVAQKPGFISQSHWPEVDAAFIDEKIERQVQSWFNIVRAVRALRADLEIDPRKPVPYAVVSSDLGEGNEILRSQAWITELITSPGQETIIKTTEEGVEIGIPITDMIDLNKLGIKVNSEVKKLSEEIAKLEQRLSNPQFVERAKPEIVEREQETLAELKRKLEAAASKKQTLGL
ncbi:MAG: valine--tRNA ligase [Armatimonadetes bacterium]|nr:valine--tRNA ligase [Armatimonadota bacterium]